MWLSTDPDRTEGRARATIAAAVQAGITVFDTAHAYGLDESDLGHNERLLAPALRDAGAERVARVVTKGGMARPGGAWRPDGRAAAIRRHCEASLTALSGVPVDCYLLHAPDPRTPWDTSVRALARLVEEGLVGRVGVSNVTRDQLDRAVELAPIAVVQVSLSVADDTALRGGVLDRCAELGLTLMAHSPLGGPRRVRRALADPLLAAVAARHPGAGAAEVALAWLLTRSPTLVAVPGARRPEAVRSAARAARLDLDEQDLAALTERFGRRRPSPAVRRRGDREVVMVMGIPGAGKTRLARALVDAARPGQTLRLNRDERGGTLRDLAEELDAALRTATAGPRRVVLDNTYLTRAARSHVLDVSAGHGVPVRCIWLDIPVAQAQVNLVTRLLDRFGRLPEPEELAEAARREPGLHTPTTLARTVRQLETPSQDEGFAVIERRGFTREEPDEAVGVTAGVVVVAAAAAARPGWRVAIAAAAPDAAHLVIDWRPDGSAADLEAVAAALDGVVAGPVATAVCSHPAGPPVCWCRPPLPGLAVAFARRHRVAPSRVIVVGVSPAFRAMASALGGPHLDPRTLDQTP
jgi:aryl-alcohol dehydrogenase-like predicted oxidoreductase/predicted kinase